MKLALIGVGLIGGSFARAMKATGTFERIVGFDNDSESLQRAVELGVIDEAAASLKQVVDAADVVMVATPVGAIRQILREIAPHLPSSCIVTDVGSVKASVIAAARDELGSAFTRFVPGHPIAGSEQSGVEHADGRLFAGAIFVATPVAETSDHATHRVEALWRDLGCRAERMTPEEHDNIFAAVSHLPHLLAFALVAQIASQPDAQRKFSMAGAGFRDFTRIARSDSAMWSDICIANRVQLSHQLKEHRTLLGKLQSAIDNGDAESLRSLFARASATRFVQTSGR